MNTSTSHECDNRCVCPVHGTAMYYAPHYGVHACQRADCQHAHGVHLAVGRLDNTGHQVVDLPRSAWLDPQDWVKITAC